MQSVGQFSIILYNTANYAGLNEPLIGANIIYQSKGLEERFPELYRHEGVDDEVDGGVDECNVVHQIAQRTVALVEEVHADGGQHAEDALKQGIR